jgi:hypothetical protein
MRNWGQIDLADIRDEDVQDRDAAIIELWDVLERHVKMIDATRHPSDRDGSHPTLEKYRRFVNENRGCMVCRKENP